MTPSVNEAHYLAKARHYWDPSWCANDLFLNSADTHLAFYWTFGWLSEHVSLPVSAWAGRFVVWGVLAFAWTRLSRTVCAVPGCALLAAALATTLCELTNMAGEWFVGGIEGKSLAWPLVLLAISHVIRSEWIVVWPLLGAASAFHVLVGGWAAVICALILVRDLSVGTLSRSNICQMLPAMLVGAAAAAIGVGPPLLMDWQTDPHVAAESHWIQVYERLPHHLRLMGMKWYRLLRFAILVAVWLVVSSGRGRSSEQTRLCWIVNGSLFITAVGAVIEVLSWAAPASTVAWQRFYWFRMSDVLVPIGATLLGVSRLASGSAWTQRARDRALAIALVWLAVWVPLRTLYLRHDRRPLAVRQSRPYRARQASEIAANYEDWRAVCAWIQRHTPRDATFLSPTNRQTFKWFAERGEFATWKGMPQDAESVVAWKRRRTEVLVTGIFVPDGQAEVEALVALADRYGLTHLLCELGYGRINGQLPLVYRNAHFAVYRFPRGR